MKGDVSYTSASEYIENLEVRFLIGIKCLSFIKGSDTCIGYESVLNKQLFNANGYTFSILGICAYCLALISISNVSLSKLTCH